jgi:hypothetical protein
VTDAGLKELAALKKLTELTVGAMNKQITDEGIKELKQALPKCRVIRLP